MIKLQNISKSFAQKKLFENFNYEFDQGIVCITGGSGCGKTTLLNIISGEIKPDSGDVLRDCKRLRMSFQEPRLLNWCSVLDNVCIKSENENAGRELLKKFSLEKEEISYPDELSGGMCQRVSIARALCDEPDVLLLDEPFNGLDSAMTETVINVIRERMKGKLIICVLHNRDIIEKLADKIIEL